MATTDTIEHKRGDTYVLQCAYKDEDGVAIDLTGYTINSKARDEDDVELFSVTNGAGITITDAANGLFTLQVDIAETELWEPARYYQDIEYVLSGVVKSTETFYLRVKPDITY